MKAQRYFPSAELEESAYYKVTEGKCVKYGCMSYHGYHITASINYRRPIVEVENFEATHQCLCNEVDFLVEHNDTFEYVDEKEFTEFFNNVQKQIADHVYDASLKI